MLSTLGRNEPYSTESTRRRRVVMLIESTEQFQAGAAIAIRRGRNEVAERDFAELPESTRIKLRILQEHGVLRVQANDAELRTTPNK